MKKAILCTMGLIALINVKAQNPILAPGQMPPSTPTEVHNPEFVQFKETAHDFGNIKQGTPVSYVFEFKNVGTKDITLVNVAASCGCTTPNWKGGVYKPGETAQITATYNAGNEGQFNKTITVTTSEGIHILTITGNTMPVPAYEEWKAKQDAAEAQKKAEEPKSEKHKKDSKKTKEQAADKTKPVKETPKKSS